MKSILSLLMAVVFAFSFMGCEQGGSSTAETETSNEFTIEGTVENADSILVLLDGREDGEWINIDSAWVEDGHYSLNGELDHAEMVYLKFVDGDDVKYINVFVEKSAMTVEGDLEDEDNMIVSGSASHDMHREFSDAYDEFYAHYDTLYTLMESTDDEQVKDSLKEMITKIEDDSDVYLKEFILQNKGSQVSPYLALRHLTYGSEFDDLNPVVSEISEGLEESKYIDALNETLAKLKILAIGKVAPEFAQVDADGNPISLSSLRGKYVLVDFWASWCGPCRRENPNVVAMYNEFSDSGFEILGVSLDKDREKWLKAIDDDKLTWQHVSDLQGWKNEVADLYNVKAIPSTYLLDKEGKIIAKNIRGDELKDKIRELIDAQEAS